MVMGFAAIGAIDFSELGVINEFFAHRHFAYTGITQRAYVHDEFVESFEWHFHVAYELGKRYGFYDIFSTRLLFTTMHYLTISLHFV